MEPETRMYQVTKGCAKWKNIPMYFVAVALAETEKALYLYGHGSVETAEKGVCMICGRTLTHPVSVILGIGPECGGHYHDWNRIGGYTMENIERLKKSVEEIVVDTWIPKSRIENTSATESIVNVPEDHPKRFKALPEENKTTEKTETPMQEITAQSPKRAVMVKNQYGERLIKIIFPYDLATLDKIRSLAGRMFHQKEKFWTCPVAKGSIENLVQWGFEIDDHLEKFLQRSSRKNAINLSKQIKGLKGVPFAYQYEGVDHIEINNGRALVADEMGLGKTIQALAWLQLHRDRVPVLIVCPASLKLNWKLEAESWLPDTDIEILTGEKPWTPTSDMLIINYDILPAWVKTLKKLDISVMITDECHYYKSNKAKRTKAVKELGKEVPYFIALSGTPIVNRPIEAYNAIHLISPKLFPNKMEYAQKYCGATYTQWGWDFNGATNTQHLHKILTDSIMIRRLKKDVLADLPDKIYQFIPLNLNNEREYNRAENDFISFVHETKGHKAAMKAEAAEVLTQIETLKQLAVRGALPESINWIEDFLESGSKLVVFAHHQFVIEELARKFPKQMRVTFDGKTTMADRQRSVDIFQYNPDCRLFVGNIKAAGVGITLTAASNVAFLELPWTPGDLRQAIDRVHRIGQRECVNVHYLFATDTIMDKIARLIDKKQRILDAVLDGKETDTDNLLYELINEYYKK